MTGGAALETESLSVRLGDHEALAGVTFRVPEGAFVAILGPNGGGKSTFFKVLLGLIEPSGGTARVLGHAPREADSRRIGYVPQFKTMDRTFPALAIELVVSGLRSAWPAKISKSEADTAEEALARVGAAPLARRAIGHLSGGELQRIYLARAFARRPDLILLDEPAQGMDVTGEADMFGILESYQAETSATILMITHDWEAAFHHASHALLLNRRVIGFGPPAEAVRGENLRQAFGHLGHAHAMDLAADEHRHD